MNSINEAFVPAGRMADHIAAHTEAVPVHHTAEGAPGPEEAARTVVAAGIGQAAARQEVADTGPEEELPAAGSPGEGILAAGEGNLEVGNPVEEVAEDSPVAAGRKAAGTGQAAAHPVEVVGTVPEEVAGIDREEGHLARQEGAAGSSSPPEGEAVDRTAGCSFAKLFGEKLEEETWINATEDEAWRWIDGQQTDSSSRRTTLCILRHTRTSQPDLNPCNHPTKRQCDTPEPRGVASPFLPIPSHVVKVLQWTGWLIVTSFAPEAASFRAGYRFA